MSAAERVRAVDAHLGRILIAALGHDTTALGDVLAAVSNLRSVDRAAARAETLAEVREAVEGMTDVMMGDGRVIEGALDRDDFLATLSKLEAP